MEGKGEIMMAAAREILKKTALGDVKGFDNGRCEVFLGVPYAKAGRFEYAVMTDHWDGVLDATVMGATCPQNRNIHEHLENPTRRFYKKEYREGAEYAMDEDCLNLNIFAPRDAKDCPVVVFIHGGGFDSGSNQESPFDGSALAERGIVTVFINYRVGVLGYFTHEEIQKRDGRDGNFGLDDQLTAIRFVKAHIHDFGGDPDNITLLGQSAGAISSQYLCLNPENKGMFQHAAMMSGAGLFPKFSLPRRAADTHEYWLQFMKDAGCESFEEFQKLPVLKLFDAVEQIKTERKDSIYHTMPVIDGKLIPAPIDEMIKKPLDLDYMIGYTNNDMYAPIMAFIGNRFGKDNGAYIYYFDLDAPGDGNKAFHSADLRFMFETLEGSWRPYGKRDHEAAGELASYLANFAWCGNPNGDGKGQDVDGKGRNGTMAKLPTWKPAKKGLFTNVLRIRKEDTKMGRVNYLKLLNNFLKIGDPKA